MLRTYRLAWMSMRPFAAIGVRCETAQSMLHFLMGHVVSGYVKPNSTVK